MSSADPFSSRFEVFGREARQVVPEINEKAFKRLIGHLSPEPGADGRVVLLSAPRAGFGKTLLIQRVAETLTEEHHFVKVTLKGGRTIDAARVLKFVLESLSQVLPAAEGLTMLDIAARRIIARGLELWVRSGEVPCQDRDGALLALQESPVETFDFHHESAVTAHWTEANFEIMGPRLAAEVAQVSGASLREAAYWVELFFRFATTSPENVERSRLLFETVFQPDGLKPLESGAGERLHGLLSLLGIATTIVLVVDDTEGLSTHPPDALELATFFTNLAQTCPGTLVLLSVNTDVWDTAFAPRLPGGLSDRLTEHRVLLKPLSREGAENIIRSRGGSWASDVLERMEWGEGDLYARRVLKAASEAWDAVVEESEEEAAAVASQELVKVPEELAPVLKPAVKSEEGPVSFSTGATTFLAKEDVDPAAVTELENALPEVRDEAPEVNPIEEDFKVLDAFEPSAYATPTTPLDATPDRPDDEQERGDEPSSVSDDPPTGFTPVEPGSLSAEVAEDPLAEQKPEIVEKPASPFVAAPPVSTPFNPEQTEASKEVASESTGDEPASPNKEDTPVKSPFSRVWESAEAEVAKEDDAETSGDAKDVWADESPTPPSSPFAAVTPRVPPSPFAPVDPGSADDLKGEDVAEPLAVEETQEKEKNSKTSPFAPASSEEKAGKDVSSEDVESSPFAAAEPSTSEKFSPPESDPSSESSPFRPLTGKSAESGSSPFEAVSPSSEKNEDEDRSSASGPGALTGGSSIFEPVSPFEKSSSGEDDVEENPSPPFSPFSPVGPPPERPTSSPFTAVGGDPGAKADSDDDEDKVDELLRQFKERYGRD